MYIIPTPNQARPAKEAPAECSLCVEHFPDKSPSRMEVNRIAFACGRQHSLDDHIDNWPLYGSASRLFDALVQMRREWAAFGSLSGETIEQADRAIREAEGLGRFVTESRQR